MLLVAKRNFHQNIPLTCSGLFRKDVVQAPVVQKVDSAIHRINRYPVDKTIGFVNAYPLDSELSSG